MYSLYSFIRFCNIVIYIIKIVHYLSQNFVNIKNFLYSFFQRYGSQSTLDYSAHTGSYPYLGDSRTVGKREIPETSSYDPDSEPRGSQYLNPNCLLLTYFNGDTSTVVDEHFSRALSQPSSFSSDRNGNQLLNTKRSGKFVLVIITFYENNYFRKCYSML